MDETTHVECWTRENYPVGLEWTLDRDEVDEDIVCHVSEGKTDGELTRQTGRVHLRQPVENLVLDGSEIRTIKQSGDDYSHGMREQLVVGIDGECETLGRNLFCGSEPTQQISPRDLEAGRFR